MSLHLPTRRALFMGRAALEPNDLVGLQLWLKADSLNLSDSDPVATWSDSSSQGNDAAQATEANKPLYIANGINGKPIVRFDGSNDTLSITDADGLDLGAAGITLFVVFKAANATGNPGLLAKAVGGGDGYLLRLNEGDGLGKMFVEDGGTYYSADTTTNVGDNTARLLTGWYDGTTITIRMNGAQEGSTTQTTTQSGNATNPSVGSVGAVQYLNGDIGEIVLYNRALTAVEMSSVESYLNQRWAVF